MCNNIQITQENQKSKRYLRKLLLASLLGLFMSSGYISNAYAQVVTPHANPDLSLACGLDVALVLDASSSVHNDITAPNSQTTVQAALQSPSSASTPQTQVRAATQSFVDSFANTGSNVAVIEFASIADTPIPYTIVNQNTLTNTFESYINGSGPGDGYHDGRLGECTNWDDGFRQINALPHKPDLVVFMTDGQPNTINGGAACGATIPEALDAAAAQANITKSGVDGSHIFVIGVGDQIVQSNLRSITEDPNQIYNTVNLPTADYTLGTFDSLYTDFQDIAFGLCAPSVTINKVVDERDGNGEVAHPDQTFVGELSVSDGNYSWTSPGTSIGLNQQGTTDSNGNLTFQWDRTDLGATSTITISEIVEDGYSFVDASCDVKTADDPTAQNLPVQVGLNAFTAQVDTGDLVTCTVHNTRHQIDVEKIVSPNALPEPGGAVTYTFQITNLGGTSVTLDSLTDDKLLDLNGQGSCKTHSSSDPLIIGAGQSYRCHVSTNVTGNANTVFTNTVTAIASNSSGAQATASDQAAVTFTDVRPTAVINKVAMIDSQPETSANFTFTLTITNTSKAESIVLTQLNDSPFGDVTNVTTDIVATNCSTPQNLTVSGQAGDSYTCQFVAKIEGNPGDYADLASAPLMDDDGNEIIISNGAVVSLTDVPPSASIDITPTPASRPEPGGIFTFTISISNTNSVEAITLQSLADSAYGDVTMTNADVVATNCQANQTLNPAGQPGDEYSCSFSVLRTGEPTTVSHTLTAQIADDDGNQVPASADSQIEIIDLPAALEVTRTANRLAVLEPGQNVSFTLTIKNSSQVDSVTITTISELISGVAAASDIAASCSISLPLVLAPGESVVCEYSRLVSGNAGDAQDSTVTVTAVDDDGSSLEENQEESIDVLDQPSSIRVTKLADVSEVMDPGDNVDYLARVENTSTADSVIINTLIDDQFGDVSQNCDSPLPATLAPRETLMCPFTRFVGGVVGSTHVNIVTASGVDDDGKSVSGSDQEEITIDDIPSSIKVIETANPSGVSEPGADVTFTAIVRNTSIADSVLITQVIRNTNGVVIDISNTCFLAPPVVLAPGEEISCEFTDFVSGSGGDSYRNQIEAFGQDDDGNPVADFDLEIVDVLDVSSSIRIRKQAYRTSVQEPSGTVTFTLHVQNTSLVDDVTVTQLAHSGQTVTQRAGSSNISNTCDVLLPVTLAPNESFSCESVEQISGPVGTVILSESTVHATDDDGNMLTDIAQSRVEITDMPSSLRVEVVAAEAGLSEPGGSVLFTAQIENTSPLDSITIQSVNSEQGGDITSSCIPSIAIALAPSEQINCTYTLTFFGDQGDNFADTVTAIGLDDDGMDVTDQDSAQVHIVNLLPTISVRKIVSPTDVPETGGDVTFTFEVINNSPGESVELQNMQDATLGDLNGQGNCLVPQSLRADGGRYTCMITLFVQGDFGNNDSAEVQATAVDNDGSQDTSFDIQEIFFTDVLPDINITTAISPSTVAETGQDVSHALILSNNSAEEVVITSLTDSAGESLDGLGSCSLPQVILGNGSYTCTFTRFISGTFGTPQTAVFVAVGEDDEENEARAANSNTILFSQVAPTIVVSKIDSLLVDTFDDASQQGLVSAGDTLAYTITVSNFGDEVATGVQLLDTPDPSTRLVVGSVQSTKGTVMTGNDAGDTTVLLDIGLLSPNETVTVTFNVLVDPVVADIQLIGNQALVSYASPDGPGGVATVESDDPSTTDDNDETKTPITFMPQGLEIGDEPLAPNAISDYIFLPMITK